MLRLSGIGDLSPTAASGRPILLKNSTPLPDDAPRGKVGLADRSRIGDRTSGEGEKTPENRPETHDQEFFNRIGRQHTPRHILRDLPLVILAVLGRAALW